MATDLSARCDRALARAARLARAWNGELIVVHVMTPAEIAQGDRIAGGVPSWRRSESCIQARERALCADVGAEGVTATCRVLVGTPAESVQQAVAELDAGLVVLGISKDEPMERIQFGSTVDGLVRRSRVPVLNVRGRARGAYRHVVVATDFSEPARHALRLATRWFGDARLTLFHAYLPPGSTLAPGAAVNEGWRATAAKQCEAHLADAALADADRARLETVLEQGQPESLLADYVAGTGADLVVLGSQGRSGVARALLGGTAENLLHRLDCDTLVVRRA
ncbi:MAG: universal stress protein [Comamonadaceae bacterium]|nr:universal stress protein [Comamonadaceae bacterium]